jgi:predicted permease
MLYAAIKIVVTAVLVVAISEAAKRSALAGGIIASLPLTSLLAFVWLYGETGDRARVAGLSRSVFWYVLPSLVMFIALPMLLDRGADFWLSLAISAALTFAAYLVMAALLARFGIAL